MEEISNVNTCKSNFDAVHQPGNTICGSAESQVLPMLYSMNFASYGPKT